MKKITALILAMSMLLGLCTYVGANNSADVKTNDAVEFLTKIGVLEITDSSMTDMVVTREDFAVYTANLLGIDVNTVSETRYFSDVNMSSYGAYAIEKLVEMGIISEAADKMFRPADKITQAEAAKILCVATGYGEYAEARGGFPTGYVRTATQNRFLINVADTNSMTIAEVAEMIYRAAQLGVYTQNTYGGEANEYSVSSDETLLSIYHDIYFDEGLITSVTGKTIDGNESLKADTMYIGSTEYKATAEIQKADRLGDYVKFFYLKQSENDMGEIIYISNEIELKSVKIYSDNFISFDGTSIEYYADENQKRTQKAQVSGSIVVYNGYPVKGNVKDAINSINKGYITVKDTDEDGKFDLIIVDDYETFVVSEKDSAKQIIYNKLGGYIDLTEYTNVRFFDVTGVETDLTGVKAGNALSIAKTKEGKQLATVYVSANSANGVIEKMGGNKEDAYITVAGNKLSVDKAYYDEFKKTVYIGGMFYYTLDMFEDIVYASTDSKSTMNYGYILDSKLEDEVFTNKAQLRLMTEKSEIIVVELADLIKVDGVKFRDDEAKAYKAIFKLNNGTPKELAIRYNLDEAGKLAEVDTPYLDTTYETELNSLTPVYKEDFGKHYVEGFRIGLKSYINNNTKVFLLPDDKAAADVEEDKINVSGGNSIGYAQSNKNLNVYTSSSLNEYQDFVINRYKESELSLNHHSQPTFLVAGLSEELNAEGEVCTKISGYLSGTFKEYTLDTDIDLGDVSEGDLVRFHFNIKDEPAKSFEPSEPDIVIIYDFSKHKGAKPAKADGWEIVDETGDVGYCYYSNGFSNGEYRQRMQLSFGFAHRKVGSSLEFGYKSGADFDELFKTSPGKIIVVDDSLKPGEKVYSGSINDVLDYETVGNECSSVIAQTAHYSYVALIVYR